MRLLDRILGWAGFTCIAIVVLLSPWAFGAWEMWWFWPFATCIFLATAILGAELLVRTFTEDEEDRDRRPVDWQDLMRLRAILVGCFLCALSYAFARASNTPVRMDAERSVLLLLTPFLVGIHILFGFNRRQAHLLFWAILANLILLGVYGIANHFITGNRLVLWTAGEPGYQLDVVRATGSYFCPDHFAGIMELAFCLALGIILARSTGRSARILAAVAGIVGLVAVVLSKSRGGGITIIVILGAAVVWGFQQWRPSTRWKARAVAVISAILLLVGFAFLGGSYVDRFGSYFGWNNTEGKSLRQIADTSMKMVRSSSRGRMIGAAMRAWRTERAFGVGPGMHQNLWPHFAATDDGNRELGKRPSQLNINFHSYEVHSDWVQLLEEYGLIGLALFMLPFCTVFLLLFRAIREETRRRQESDWADTERSEYHLILGGFLAAICMTFHSLGDFNLQIPATTWILSAIIALALLASLGPCRETR